MKCQFSLIHLFTQQYYCKSSNHIACTANTENDGLAPWPGGTHIVMTCKCLSLVLNPFSLHLPSPVHVMYLDYQGNVLVCHGQQQGGKHIKNALRLTRSCRSACGLVHGSVLLPNVPGLPRRQKSSCILF